MRTTRRTQTAHAGSSPSPEQLPAAAPRMSWSDPALHGRFSKAVESLGGPFTGGPRFWPASTPRAPVLGAWVTGIPAVLPTASALPPHHAATPKGVWRKMGSPSAISIDQVKSHLQHTRNKAKASSSRHGSLAADAAVVATSVAKKHHLLSHHQPAIPRHQSSHCQLAPQNF